MPADRSVLPVPARPRRRSCRLSRRGSRSRWSRPRRPGAYRRPVSAGCAPAGGDPGKSRLPGQGLGYADGRRPPAVRRGRREGARVPCRPRGADVDFLGFHVFAGSQNLSAEILCEAQRKTVDLILHWPTRRPADPLRQPRRRLRHPVLRQGQPTRPRRDRGQPRRAGRPRIPEPSGAEVVIELGRYIVGECGVYVTRVVDRKVSGDGRIWWSMAACTTSWQRRELRPGHPAGLSDRGWQPHHRAC